MFKKHSILLGLLAAFVGVAVAYAGNTSILTSIGDVTFPFTPPTTAGAAGAIDNMVIGATTPRGASVTTLSATGAVSGAGFTSRLASPGPIGSTAASTGAFTTLAATSGATINGDAGTSCASYYFTGTPAATNQVFFVAPRAFLLVSVSEVHSAAAGGASKLQVTLDTTTSAPAGGTALLTNNTNAGFDLAATANTVQVATLVAAGTRTLAAGDRLAVKFANAIQSSAGVVVSACLQAI